MLLTDDLLLNYKRCERRTFLDAYANPNRQDPKKEFLLKLKRENQLQINRVLAEQQLVYHQPLLKENDLFLKAKATEELMARGVDCIYDGVLLTAFQDWDSLNKNIYGRPEVFLVGNPTLLIKQTGSSIFGNWSYFALNIKLGNRAKSEYKLIATFQTQILTAIQGADPAKAELILRQKNTYSVQLDLWHYKTQESLLACLNMLLEKKEPSVFISRQKCNLCHWYGHCYQIAKSQNHLCLIPGVTPSRYEYLQNIGVSTVEDLAGISADTIGEEMTEEIALQLVRQAESIVRNEPIIKNLDYLNLYSSIFNSSIELYFDIEAEPERNIDYLLGILLVDRQQKSENFFPLLAEKLEEEELIWQRFLRLVELYPQAPIYHYSKYEVEAIGRMAKLYHTPTQQIDSLLSRFIDIHLLVTTSVIFPVENYSLKTLANWLGFQWRDPGVSGEQCVCWYDNWLQTGDRSLLQSILRYNEDDCKATRYLKNWSMEFLKS